MDNRVILEGIPASVGTANGKVKKIFSPNDFSDFEQGSILVTEMTSPLFLPIMRKASAIITDIGGLLCHAAIVAREFRIPCIVNTKEATKILKNGQHITVNATKGKIYEKK